MHNIFYSKRKEIWKIILFVRAKTKKLRSIFVLMCETDGKEQKNVISQDFSTFHRRTFLNTIYIFFIFHQILPKGILI